MLIDVRLMTAADLPIVCQIENAAFENRRQWTPEQFVDALNFDKKSNRRRSQWVAVVGIQVVGFVIAKLDRPAHVIENLAVNPAYQRQGVGSELMVFLRDRSDVYTTIIAYAGQSNRRCWDFFTANHFSTNLIDDYYGTGQDAIEYVYTMPEVATRNRIAKYFARTA